jgi:hypothetical protein
MILTCILVTMTKRHKITLNVYLQLKIRCLLSSSNIACQERNATIIHSVLSTISTKSTKSNYYKLLHLYLSGLRHLHNQLYYKYHGTVLSRKIENTAVGIRHADHVTPSFHKSWQSLSRQAAVARPV